MEKSGNDTTIPHYNNGLDYFKKQEYEKALESFEQAEKVNRYDTNVLYYKGITLLKLGNLKGALGCLDKLNSFNSPQELLIKAKKVRTSIISQLKYGIPMEEKEDEIEEDIDSDIIKPLLPLDVEELSNGRIFLIIGMISLLGAFGSLLIFIIEMIIGYYNWGLLVSAIISIIVAFGWFAIHSKFELSANIHSSTLLDLKTLKDKDMNKDT